jgi:hypothetical protein
MSDGGDTAMRCFCDSLVVPLAAAETAVSAPLFDAYNALQAAGGMLVGPDEAALNGERVDGLIAALERFCVTIGRRSYETASEALGSAVDALLLDLEALKQPEPEPRDDGTSCCNACGQPL